VSKITIIRESCKGVEDCGICIHVCPKDVLIQSGQMNEQGYLPPEVRDEEACNRCQSCMVSCPDFAVIVEKDKAASSKDEEDLDA